MSFLRVLLFGAFIGSIKEYKSIALNYKIRCFGFIRMKMLLRVFYLFFRFGLFFREIILRILEDLLNLKMDSSPFSIIIFKQLFL